MATTINADTSTGGAVVTGDSSGVLALQAAGVTQVTINSSGVTLANPLPVASGGTGSSSGLNLATSATGTLPIANGGTNSTAVPTAGGVVYGTGTAQAVTAAGTSGQFLTSAGAGTPTWSSVTTGFTLATPLTTTSGATAEFTGIPAGVKVIHINLAGVSFSAAQNILMQVGTASAYLTTGYTSKAGYIASSMVAPQGSTTYFLLNYTAATSAADAFSGTVILTLLNASTNLWCLSGNLAAAASTSEISICAGSITMTDAITRLKIYPSSGNFDAGSINIAYS
jgi:hypothetical protein